VKSVNSTVTQLPAGEQPALECRGVSVDRGGNRVVAEVDLVVEEGDWVAIVGPNGAGKTSLLHAVAGLIPATGELRVGGLDPGRAPRREVAQVVALMPQRPVVPEGTTVRELVALGRTPHLRRFGTETAADREAVEQTLHRLELTELAERPALGLSGGELQRAVLGRALAQEPRVLLLDEPTSALDIGHQQSVLDLVNTMRLEDELTVVAAMHDLTLAGQYGRRVVLLDNGRVVADASPSEVLRPVRLADVYGARVEVLQRDTGPAVLPVPADSTPRTEPLARRILVLGGARSGKSRHAQRLLADCAEVLYVAPGPVPDDSDSDWAARVVEHRRNRPPGWTTLETDDVPAVLESATQPVLVDCLATWLAGVMDAAGAWESSDGDTAWHEKVDVEVERLLNAWKSASVPVVAVSNEVGSGVVPATRSGVLFRDALGRLNRRVADLTDDVRLVVAGRVQRLEDERA
jgi:iron complex transport system ATP-binding protein